MPGLCKRQHQAEVWLAGLLQAVPETATAVNPEKVQYDFRPDIRDRLLNALPRSDALEVLKCTSEYIEKHLGRLFGLAGMLANPKDFRPRGQLRVTDDPLARIASDVLLRLGGDYARLVQETKPRASKKSDHSAPRTRLAEPPPELEHSPAPVLWPDSPPTIPMAINNHILAGNQQARIYDVGFPAGYFHVYDHFQTNGAAYPEREIQVFLPRNYESEQNRYPVIYMHDGNMAFFKGGLANQTWDVANTLGNFYRDRAAPKFIVVAIYPVDRNREYTHAAWCGPAWGGLSSYCSCIADWIKPFIDEHYRTLPERENTMILGSSHGGLAAFYIANQSPDKFGFCSALSPSFWVGVDHGEDFPVVRPNSNASLRGSELISMCRETLADVKRRPIIYLDWGLVRTWGPHNEFIEERAAARASEMAEVLRVDYGYRIGEDLLVYEDPQGEHNEESWGKRLPRILQYFIRQIRYGETKAPDDHEPRIPPEPRCFGREQEVEALVRTVLEPQPRPAIVLGAQGIGKSTVCKAVLHREEVRKRYKDRRFFVQCKGLRSLEALLSAIAKAPRHRS